MRDYSKMVMDGASKWRHANEEDEKKLAKLIAKIEREKPMEQLKKTIDEGLFKFDEKMKKQEEERQKIVKNMKNDLTTLFLDIFEKCPTVKAVRWTQDTPAFNDGDPCIFGVNTEFSVLLDGADPEEEWADSFGEGYPSEMKEFNRRFEKLVPSENYDSPSPAADALRIMFGDPVQVSIHRDGTVEVSDYDNY